MCVVVDCPQMSKIMRFHHKLMDSDKICGKRKKEKKEKKKEEKEKN
jgi:hypothetical protein